MLSCFDLDMLKTHHDETTWLVHQPDHARVSGYLAAHWGGVNGFLSPGHYPGSAELEVWREEVVLAIAEHDNGWWEWEAAPPIDPADGLPYGLADIGKPDPGAGLQRWRLGVPRFAEEHPYAALLLSMHPYWLYAFAFDDLAGERDEPLRHGLSGSREDAADLVSDRAATRRLLDELQAFQAQLGRRLAADPVWAAALEPAHLYPHFKLLQLMDALSLMLSMNRRDERRLADVPRGGWHDRVTLTWRPLGERRIACNPYPFDTDPLEVYLPVRLVSAATSTEGEAVRPLTRLHATPLQTVRFEISSAH
jgi:hypothetical protein